MNSTIDITKNFMHLIAIAVMVRLGLSGPDSPVSLDYPAVGHNFWTTDTPPKGHSVQSSNSNNHNCFLKQVMTYKNGSHKILHEMSIKYKQLFPNIV